MRDLTLRSDCFRYAAGPRRAWQLLLVMVLGLAGCLSDGKVQEVLGDRDHDHWRDCGDRPSTADDPCDCADADPDRNPDKAEVCNSQDDDCNGGVDDGLQFLTYYADRDGDGSGDTGAPVSSCQALTGYVLSDGDCDDTNSRVYPGAAEVCNGQDDDCDGTADDGLTFQTYYEDKDGDSYGDTATSALACENATGYVLLPGDCDDADAATHPTAPETCDGLDNDCDGENDEGLTFSEWYPDVDGDGYGASTQASETGGTPAPAAYLYCAQPVGYVANDLDCDDTDGAFHPYADESCGEVDEPDYNCDGSTGYEDLDRDGAPACSEGDQQGDCDDGDGDRWPGHAEDCDGKDNDCNGVVDDNVVQQVFYRDEDGDGYGTSDKVTSAAQCELEDWSQTPGDCEDDPDEGGASIHPGAAEQCNGIDDDCDGTVDNGLPSISWYEDRDHDGYGNPDVSVTSCAGPDNYVANGEDCRDDPFESGASYHPGAAEECGSSDDLNCDGSTGDQDEDGDGRAACNDCDDSDPAVYGAEDAMPAAEEVCDNKDNDCNGVADDVHTSQNLYRDQDGDGHGTDNPSSQELLEVPFCTAVGWSLTRDDCADSDASVYVGADELCDGKDNDCDGSTPDEEADGDGDGVLSCSTGAVPADCDDGDPSRSPLQTEACDGIDNDCDYVVDESADDATTWYLDADGDGYGDPSYPLIRCTEPGGYVANDGDCNDLSVSVNPDALERCDTLGVDENCNGLVNGDDPAVDASTASPWYADRDGDGYGGGNVVYACDDPSSSEQTYQPLGDDCNDDDLTVHPNATEYCTEPIDRNCDGSVQYQDKDGDGAAACVDCDDNPETGGALRYPGALEVCDADNVDEDCDVAADNADPEGASGTDAWFPDADGDGHGDPAAEGTQLCDDPSSPEQRWSRLNDDCDDARDDISPSRPEICDAEDLDEDCDGQVNETGASGATTWYLDTDADGYGSSSTTAACSLPEGYADNATDCDDTRSDVHPNAAEVCDAADADEDCDGQAEDSDDSVDPLTFSTWYTDADGDGFGGSEPAARSCEPESGEAATADDCDDLDAAAYPDAPEQCNSVDDDCDGETDEQVTTTWYQDSDSDGYGNAAASFDGCAPPEGYVANDDDCDDSDAEVHPGADDDLEDGLDADCSDQVSDVYVSPAGHDPETGAVVVATISEALAIAPEGGVVLVEAGRYVESLYFDQLNLTLRSVSGPESTTIVSDGNQGSTIRIKGGLVSLEGFTVTGGLGMAGSSATDACGHSTSSSERHGGGICGRDTTLTLTDMILSSSSSTYGGQLYVRDSTAYLTDSTLSGGSSSSYGGGLYARTSTVELVRVTVSGNSVSSDGGGIYALDSNLSLVDSEVLDNTATKAGGGLTYSNSSASRAVIIRDSEFHDNGATTSGGALYLSSSGPLTVSDTTIHDNTAIVNGGGGYLEVKAGITWETEGLTVEDNTANGSGGGLYVSLASGSFAEVSDLTLRSNTCNADGGGLYVTSQASSAHISLTASGNSANDEGGGLYLSGNTSTVIVDSSLESNSARNRGGGAYLSGGALEDVLVEDNFADEVGGGGIYTAGTPLLTRVTVRANRSDVDGAGLYVSSAGTYRNLVISDNDAQRDGGGVYLSGSGAQLSNVTVAWNRAWSRGGGMYLTSSSAPTIHNSIVAYNPAAGYGGNLYYAGTSSSPTYSLSDSVVYNPPEDGESLYGISSFVLSTYGIVQEDPQFIRDPRYGGRGAHDFHLNPDSPAVDAGSSSSGSADPDGSANDFGAYGGLYSSATDVDGDGLPDDWERSSGNEPSSLDPDGDPDNDGLLTSEEYGLGLNPTSPDTDGDGFPDGDEIDSGTQPLDAADMDLDPTTANTRLVSGTAADLQDALDAAFPDNVVQVAPGTYTGNLFLAFKPVVLESTGGADVTTLQGDGTQSVMVIQGTPSGAALSGLTITGGTGITTGSSRSGGGVDIEWSIALLDSMNILGNSADYGGGIYIHYSNLELTFSSFVENVASYDGGGIDSYYGNLDIASCYFAEQSASSDGGGIYSSYGSVEVTMSQFDGNSAATFGGAISLSYSTSEFSNAVLKGNYARYGGGIYFDHSSSQILNVSIVGNEATDGGGINNGALSTLSLTNTVIEQNTANVGGGMEVGNSTSTITNTVFEGNSASSIGGGIYHSYGTASIYYTALKNVILAFNAAGTNGSNLYREGGTIASSYTVFVASSESSSSGVYGYTPSSTDQIVDPLFLNDSSDGESSDNDYHLQFGSPAIGTGDPTLFDPDGTRSDIGVYGGAGADDYDLDGDGVPGWWWPGGYADPPDGVTASDFDCDDLDPTTTSC